MAGRSPVTGPFCQFGSRHSLGTARTADRANNNLFLIAAVVLVDDSLQDCKRAVKVAMG
jgi:hypothetical protein